MPDWTVPFDDFLVQRFLVCIICAQPADRQELRSSGDFALTLGLCYRCVKADTSEQRRQAVVEEHARTPPQRQSAS
jgi:hypothetical protein